MRGDGIRRRKDRGNAWQIDCVRIHPETGMKKRIRRLLPAHYGMSRVRRELERLRGSKEASAETKPPTFAEYARCWRRSQAWDDLKTSTTLNYEVHLRRHLVPRFGRAPLDGITRTGIKAYLDELVTQGKLSRATIKNILGTLRSMFTHAVEDGILENNVAVRLGRFNRCRNEKRQVEFLTEEESNRFLEVSKEVRPRRYALFLAALRAGLRLGELIALRWDDIQFGESELDANRYIMVRRNFVLGEFTSPKSRKERRVDLNVELRRVLLEMRDEQLLREMSQDEEMSPLVFPSETGGPLDFRNLYHRDFIPCLKAAGLRSVTFHSLRHSFASHLIKKGASIVYVKDQLGHSSIQVTVDTYGHLVPGGNINWIDSLSSGSKAPSKAPAYCNV